MHTKNNLLFLAIFLVFIFLFFLIRQSVKNESKERTFMELQDRERIQIFFNTNSEVQLGQEALLVEVVNTPASTTQGLSGRTDIGADGMLFVFPQKQVRYFWMKDMRFDIDIVWISDNKVVGITPSVPKPVDQTPDNRLETYSSQQEIDMVLELKAQDAKKYDINPGDAVQLVE